MSRLPVPTLESATGATAEIYAQIPKNRLAMCRTRLPRSAPMDRLR